MNLIDSLWNLPTEWYKHLNYIYKNSERSGNFILSYHSEYLLIRSGVFGKEV